MNIPNFDACTHDDLTAFWMNHQRGRNRKALGIVGPNSVNLTATLAAYAINKATAMTCRLRGDIMAAMTYETICDNIYDRLPEDVKW
jgi:hypothetical protein